MTDSTTVLLKLLKEESMKFTEIHFIAPTEAEYHMMYQAYVNGCNLTLDNVIDNQ